MKNAVWRPLLVVFAVVAVILVARVFIVPKDFGVGPKGYRFSWHRIGNEADWKNVKVKYQGSDYCSACHQGNYDSIKASPHANVQCENCHGPALDHPTDPAKLTIDTSRELCLRCHNGQLAYPTSRRQNLPTVDPDEHNAGIECSSCHNPHSPVLGGS